MKRFALVMGLAALPTSALAGSSGFRVGLDLENGFAIDGALPLGFGFGFDAGYSVGFVVGRLIPEIGFAYYPESQVAAPKFGGSLFLGKGVEGGVYMHGVVPFAPTFSPGALGFDAGLALDFTFVPRTDFGLHFGGQWIGETDETIDSPDEELVFGGHVGFRI